MKFEFADNDSFKNSTEANSTTVIIEISLKMINPLVTEDLNCHNPMIIFEYIT